MYPILLSLGPIKISSFGVFLVLGILAAVYFIWKLAKTYDIGEEKILDLAILTFFGGVIGARLYFIAWHFDAFANFGKILLINRYPGLSFWGGLFGGLLTLYLLTKKFKLNFWQIADFAAIGFLAGLILGDLGCFLGGCFYGVPSNLPFATPIIGVIGRRFPIAIIESLILLAFFSSFWKQSIRFHFFGKIFAFSLMLIGIVKSITQIYRGDIRPWENIFPIILFAFGATVYYLRSKRRLSADLKFVVSIFTTRKNQELVLSSLKKSCYNTKVNWKIRLDKFTTNFSSLPKILKRRFNVKSTPKNFR